jgi:DNA-binding IclR family transcriptional regulator
VKTVKSIVKASKVLELFSNGDQSLGLREIARSLNIDEGTTSHIVSTLVNQGFLKQQQRRGKYSLGLKYLNLSAVINANLKKGSDSISYLIELSRLINETVLLFLWNGSDMYTGRALYSYYESLTDMSIELKISPLHSTALGKLILCGLSEEDLNKYFRSKSLEKFTPDTIIDIDQMKEHLLFVKRECIAYEIGENISDLNSIAAGIRDTDGEIIGAIVVSGSSSRLTREVLEKITPTVKLCALKISRELGYHD